MFLGVERRRGLVTPRKGKKKVETIHDSGTSSSAPGILHTLHLTRFARDERLLLSKV